MSELLEELSQLRNQDIIKDIDFELCRFLNQHEKKASDSILLAGCLLSYLYRQGDVCLQLDRYAGQAVFNEAADELNIKAPDLEKWRSDLSQSTSVGAPGDFKPLIMDNSRRLYLHKLWYYEKVLADQLLKRSRKVSTVDKECLKDGWKRLFPASVDTVNWQQVAAANAVTNKLSIISGGPGTGKTSTVVRIMALLLEQARAKDTQMSIALTAPTGKAAARLKESVLSAKDELEVSEEIREAIPDEAMTLHQLLGARRNTSVFKYNEDNRIPFDVVIVDEASMVDQALMSKLMQALLDDARLILLGDKDQLASVEAGAVLGDICDMVKNSFSSEAAGWLKDMGITIPDSVVHPKPNPLTNNITLLTKSYRFGSQSGIGQLASCINEGDADRALQVLASPDYGEVQLRSVNSHMVFEDFIRQQVVKYFREIGSDLSLEEAVSSFSNFQILSAHRKGPWGVESLNSLVEKILQSEQLIPKYEHWYAGKPVIVNTNDYTLGLHNGDTGICYPDARGNLKVYFRHEDRIRAVLPNRLPDNSTAYALTVHKSQGSEFKHLLFILPNNPSKILTRELLYTAVTRALTSVTILGSESILKQGINKKLQRTSGLRDRLWTLS